MSCVNIYKKIFYVFVYVALCDKWKTCAKSARLECFFVYVVSLMIRCRSILLCSLLFNKSNDRIFSVSPHSRFTVSTNLSHARCQKMIQFWIWMKPQRHSHLNCRLINRKTKNCGVWSWLGWIHESKIRNPLRDWNPSTLMSLRLAPLWFSCG